MSNKINGAWICWPDPGFVPADRLISLANDDIANGLVEPDFLNGNSIDNLADAIEVLKESGSVTFCNGPGEVDNEESFEETMDEDSIDDWEEMDDLEEMNDADRENGDRVKEIFFLHSDSEEDDRDKKLDNLRERDFFQDEIE